MPSGGLSQLLHGRELGEGGRKAEGEEGGELLSYRDALDDFCPTLVVLVVPFLTHIKSNMAAQAPTVELYTTDTPPGCKDVTYKGFIMVNKVQTDVTRGEGGTEASHCETCSFFLSFPYCVTARRSVPVLGRA